MRDELSLGAETKFPSNASHNSISIQPKLSLENSFEGHRRCAIVWRHYRTLTEAGSFCFGVIRPACYGQSKISGKLYMIYNPPLFILS
jgi:hypothetical protein